MALASQSTRPQSVRAGGGFQSPRQRRQRNTMIGAVVALLVIGGTVWAIWGRGGPTPQNQPGQAGTSTPTSGGTTGTNTPANNPGTNPASNTPRELVQNVPIVPAPQPEKPREPVVLDMGKPKGETPGTQPVPGNQLEDPLAKPSNAITPVTPEVKPIVPEVKPTPAAAPAPAADDVPAEVSRLLDTAKRATSENKLIEARTALLAALKNDRVKAAEREGIRTWISELNETIIFSPTVVAGDPFTENYKVASGDVLERIAKNKGLAVTKELLARVNRMPNPDRLKIGQNLKLVKGPFHAVVHKSDFRVDIYGGTPVAPGTTGSPRADGAEEGWTYIRSFACGLGESSGTPLGTFVVKRNSKLINPHWVNPKTGEKFSATDPKNPIGEHWLGIAGVDEAAKTKTGFGLHGTIDPDSIGKERSMGCVRMRAEDIAVVWELLSEDVSTVRIVQ